MGYVLCFIVYISTIIILQDCTSFFEETYFIHENKCIK